jgi:hypothetical protein
LRKSAAFKKYPRSKQGGQKESPESRDYAGGYSIGSFRMRMVFTVIFLSEQFVPFVPKAVLECRPSR